MTKPEVIQKWSWKIKYLELTLQKTRHIPNSPYCTYQKKNRLFQITKIDVQERSSKMQSEREPPSGHTKEIARINCSRAGEFSTNVDTISKFSSCIRKTLLNMIKTNDQNWSGKASPFSKEQRTAQHVFQNNIEKALKGRLKPEASKRKIYIPCCNILSEVKNQKRQKWQNWSWNSENQRASEGV